MKKYRVSYAARKFPFLLGVIALLLWGGTRILSGIGGFADSSISADGRYLAFVSYTPNLLSRRVNIFVHDLHTKRTHSIPVAPNGVKPDNAHAVYRDTSLSADGRFVAFRSYASNLVSDDTNDTDDIFVYDRQTEEITRVSVASDGRENKYNSFDAKISANGRYVAFTSFAGTLVAGDANSHSDVFVHDRETGQTVRVSVSSEGIAGDGDSAKPSISADGRYIAFVSAAGNLVAKDVNDNELDVFVHDLFTGETVLASIVPNEGTKRHNPYGTQVMLSPIDYPTISADGRYVVWICGSLLYINEWQVPHTIEREIQSDEFAFPFTYMAAAGAPALSTDGRYMAFTGHANRFPNKIEKWFIELIEKKFHIPSYPYSFDFSVSVLVIYDWETGQVESQILNPSPKDTVIISGDGRYVVYEKEYKVYVYDRQVGKTRRIRGSIF